MKDAVQIFLDHINKNNLKVTPQRRLILDVFLKETGHITPEELYDKVRDIDPSVGNATVYRTLRLLMDSGLARSVDFADGLTRYEVKAGHGHHDHLICTECKKSIEILDEDIERLQEEIAKKNGFTLTNHSMNLYGICSECREKAKKS